MDRRQVDDVEPSSASCGSCFSRPSARPRSAGTAHTRRRSGPAPDRPRSSSGALSVTRPCRSCVALDGVRPAPAPSATSCLADSGMASSGQLCERVLDQPPVGRGASPGRPRRGAAALPRTSRPRDRAGRPRPCARARRARSRTRRSTPRSCTPSGRGWSTRNSPSQRTPSRWASVAVHLGLLPAPAARARDGGRPRAAGRGRRGRCPPRRARCRRRSAWPGNGRRRRRATDIGSRSVGRR